MTLKCENCGGTVNLDTDLPIAYCPYCGAKSLIDVNSLGQVYTEKEKTNRAKVVRNYDLQIEREKTKRARQQAVLKILSSKEFYGILIFVLYIVFWMYLLHH